MSTQNAALGAKVIAYLDELAADILEHEGENPADIYTSIAAAYGRRQAFAREMAENKTDRAKKARALIVADTYGRLIHKHIVDSALDSLSEVEDFDRRRTLVESMGAQP